MIEQPVTSQAFPGCWLADPGLLESLCAQMFRSVLSDARLQSECENVEPEFNELTRKWKSERSATSSVTAIVTHPSYQRIIGLGKPALRLILRELARDLDHWFWALKAISGDDPVPAEHRGNLKEMALDWLKWGRQKGYVR